MQEENTELETATAVAIFREGEIKSVHLTRIDPALVIITSSETIQKLPDRNVADAVMCFSDVSVQRDQGESRFVSVRGTPKDWNTMLINGDRLPAANEEGDTRVVALDFFPSDMIQHIKITKALLPEYEADGIGASVQFTTKPIPEIKPSRRELVRDIMSRLSDQCPMLDWTGAEEVPITDWLPG